jgi:hypothetical protein
VPLVVADVHAATEGFEIFPGRAPLTRGSRLGRT